MTRSWRIGAAVIAAAMAMASTPALADDGPPAKVYIFQGHRFVCGITEPGTLVVGERQRAKFDRLLRLKKSFEPVLLRTAKDLTFKQ